MQVALKTTAKKHRATLNGAIGFAETATLYETAQQITQNPKETLIDWSNLTSIHYAGCRYCSLCANRSKSRATKCSSRSRIPSSISSCTLSACGTPSSNPNRSGAGRWTA
jgi:biotin synthase-like enzyme